ncbi:hypothetical protein LSH36_1635g00032, partial [Paralvinella palmiformis]
YKDAIRSPGDDLLILHCVEFPYIPQYVPRIKNSNRPCLDEAKVEGLKVEEKYKKLASENQVDARLVSQFGSPGELIVKKAKEENVIMIIMGTRGMGKIRRTILGSVSDYVVHHAHCPVIVTRN